MVTDFLFFLLSFLSGGVGKASLSSELAVTRIRSQEEFHLISSMNFSSL